MARPPPHPVDDPVVELLLSGRAAALAQAEEMDLDEHLAEVRVLAADRTDKERVLRP